MITNFSKYIAAPLAMLVLAGCGSFPEEKIREPNKKEYENSPYQASMIDRTNEKHLGKDLFIDDENGDGKVDLIQFMGLARWVAEGYTSKNREVRKGFTKTMTPEIQAAANRELQAEKDLAFLIHQENYKLQQKKQK